MDKKQRMQELIETILMHNELYYKLDKPIISDDEWDELYFELVKLEEETGVIFPNSPTQKIGDGVLDGLKKVKHQFKLYSLDKCQKADDMIAWILSMNNKYGVTEFSVEYKYDGLKIVCEYNTYGSEFMRLLQMVFGDKNNFDMSCVLKYFHNIVSQQLV